MLKKWGHDIIIITEKNKGEIMKNITCKNGLKSKLLATLTSMTLCFAICLSVFGGITTGFAAAEYGEPFILSMTDAVKGGEEFSINGENLTEDSVVYIKPAAADVEEEYDWSGTSLTPIQHDGVEDFAGSYGNQYLVCRLPYDAVGAYDVWVFNDDGESNRYRLNDARALFISDNEAWAGQYIDISGRNFDVSEFGLPKTTPIVTLINKANANLKYEAEVSEYNPYRIRFIVPSDMTLGDYDVFVTTTPGSLVGLKEIIPQQSEVMSLKVVEVGNDPLGLNASWAKNINWDKIFDITTYGANPIC